MHRYTLTLPRQYNTGERIPAAILGVFENRLLGTFGGFTLTESLGAWIGDSQVYVEPVGVYTLDADEYMDTALDVIAADAARDLEQESVYVTHVEPDGTQSRRFVTAAEPVA